MWIEALFGLLVHHICVGQPSHSSGPAVVKSTMQNIHFSTVRTDSSAINQGSAEQDEAMRSTIIASMNAILQREL